ncbi:MAG: hypothetical protein JO305_02810 [Alphaproteobacteria bacterium]|nr:hypothetical protein [Alphaproteobacteria bacterium]
MAENPEDRDEPASRGPAVVGLVVVVVLVVIAYFLVMSLRRTGELQDCAMSGRTNCAVIDSPSGSR